MKQIFIVLITLGLSWLPTTASALLLEYDLELSGNIWGPTVGGGSEGIRKIYNGTAVASFDGPYSSPSDMTLFSMDMSFTFDIDGTTLSADGDVYFGTSDGGGGVMNFADGSMGLSIPDGPYVPNCTDDGLGGTICTFYPPTGGDPVERYVVNNRTAPDWFLDYISLDPSWEMSSTTFENFELAMFNGREITSVPEPSILWLFGSGLLGFIGFNRRRV